MGEKEVKQFLSKGRILRLATVDARGVPHITPVWYIYDGSKFYILTSRRSRKVENILGKDTVSLCVDVGEGYWERRAVVVWGKGRVLEDAGTVKEKGVQILGKYFRDMNHPTAQRLLTSPGNVIIEVTPERTTSWDYTEAKR